MQIVYHKISARSPAVLVVLQLDRLVTFRRNHIGIINDADNQLAL